ncbi:hypothetical protein D9M68_565530 [compost metagenome]
MIRFLKLQKAVYAIILGVLTLLVAQLMEVKHMKGSQVILGISGILLIAGALLFLYPILFAKKIDNEGEKVELQPVEKDNEERA